MLNTTLSIHSDSVINEVILPITPPPAQFMDSYGKSKTSEQEQPLGSVPEEEESDWSEMGEDTPRFVLTGSNRSHAWRFQEVDADKDSESGGDEVLRPHSPRPLQIPHLQFTIHNENLSDSMAGEGVYRITTGSALGSTILIRSASLEDIPLARHHTQEELRDAGTMMDLHYQGDSVITDLDNEIIHHWRQGTGIDTAIGSLREDGMSEADSSMASLQSAELMLSHFICDPSDGGNGQSRTEVHEWKGGISEKVLKGQRTQL